jgi:hypothetical protein
MITKYNYDNWLLYSWEGVCAYVNLQSPLFREKYLRKTAKKFRKIGFEIEKGQKPISLIKKIQC